MFSEANFKLWYERLDRANSVALYLRAVPFVRLVGLNGSMMTGTMTPNSDIDIYIATAPNRLFTARLLVTLLVHLTGWRRYGNKIRGRICLNRFATTNALDITPHNEYHARVFSKLAPLYADRQTYEQFVGANGWVTDWNYRLNSYELTNLEKSWTHFMKIVGEYLLGGWVGNIIEKAVGNWQRRRILNDERTSATGSKVRVSSEELCFHPIKNK